MGVLKIIFLHCKLLRESWLLRYLTLLCLFRRNDMASSKPRDLIGVFLLLDLNVTSIFTITYLYDAYANKWARWEIIIIRFSWLLKSGSTMPLSGIVPPTLAMLLCILMNGIGAISCSTTRIHDPFLLPRSPAPNFLFSYISTSLPCIFQHPLTSTMRHSTNPTTVSSLPR